MDIHLVVKYAVHHSKAVLAPSFFQCWIVEQGSYTAGAIKVTSNIVGTPALTQLTLKHNICIIKIKSSLPRSQLLWNF